MDHSQIPKFDGWKNDSSGFLLTGNISAGTASDLPSEKALDGEQQEYGTDTVAIKALSERAEALKNGRLVVMVGVRGSGRQSALIAWAKNAGRLLCMFQVKDGAGIGLVPQVTYAQEACERKPDASDSRTNDLQFEGIGRPPPNASLVIDRTDQVLHHEELDYFIDSLVAYAINKSSVFLLTTQPDLAQRIWADHPRSVTVIDWDNLVITVEEAHAIACQYGNPSLELVAAWVKEMHGWMFGVCLLAQSKFVYTNPRMGLPRPVHHFLKAKLFERLPSDFREMLMAVAMLPAITQEICERLAIPHAIEMLKKYTPLCFGLLRRDGADDMHYTLHPLFRRFLWGELVDQLGQERASALSTHVARSLGGDQAVPPYEILIASRKYDELANYVEEQTLKVPFDARVETASRLLEDLPDGDESNHPTLAYWRAWTLRSRETAKSKSLYMVAAEGYLQMNNVAKALNSWGWAATLIGMRFGAGRELDRSVEWIEAVEKQATSKVWYLQYPRVCCTVAVILAMRHPRKNKTRDWIFRAAESLALNSTGAVGGLVLVGLSLALLNHLDTVRLEALDAWCSSTADKLLGPDAKKVRAFVHTCALIAQGQLQKASDLLHANPLCSDSSGGIPVSDAFLMLTSTWIGVPAQHSAQERFQPFMKWNSSTSDFYCLKLIGEASDCLQKGDQAKAKDALGLAYSLSSNIEFPFIAEFCALCLAQFNCITGEWAEAKNLLDQLDAFRRREEPLPLLDLQESMLENWVEMNLEKESSTQNAACLALHALCFSGKHSLLPLHPILVQSMLLDLSTRNPTPPRSEEENSLPTLSQSRMLASRSVNGSDAKVATNYLLSITTFGGLRVFSWEPNVKVWQPIALQKKLETFLRILLIRGPNERLNIAEVCDEMWPDAEGDAAKRNFDSMVHRMRKAFGRSDTVGVKGGRLCLNTEIVNVDLYRVLEIGEGVMVHESQAKDLAASLLAWVNGSFSLLEPEIPVVKRDLRRRRMQLKSTLNQVAVSCKSHNLIDLAADLYSRIIRFIELDADVMHDWLSLLMDMGRIEEAGYIFRRHIEELRTCTDNQTVERLAQLVSKVR